MAAKLQHFSPKQLAKALAVSESSVKRWCDQQRIPTVLTEGGHRRISLDGIFEFLRQSGRSLPHPEELGLPPLCPSREMAIPGAEQPVQQVFRDALVAGCEKTCRQIASEKRALGERASSIAEHLLTDAMHAVGRGWACKAIDPYQERRACEICLQVIHDLLDDLPPPDDQAPIAIGGAPAGDHYQLPSAMVGLTLRELGWNAINLGNNLPMECFFQAAYDYNPRLVWMSVSYLSNEAEFVAAQNRFAESLPDNVILLLGGQALTDPIRPKLRYTAYCDGLSHLTELAGILVSA